MLTPVWGPMRTGVTEDRHHLVTPVRFEGRFDTLLGVTDTQPRATRPPRQEQEPASEEVTEVAPGVLRDSVAATVSTQRAARRADR